MRGYVIGGAITIACGSVAAYGFMGGGIPPMVVAAVFTALTTISVIATIVDYNNMKVSNG